MQLRIVRHKWTIRGNGYYTEAGFLKVKRFQTALQKLEKLDRFKEYKNVAEE
jgi:hypothetical protein